jgi:hypothetical protein
MGAASRNVPAVKMRTHDRGEDELSFRTELHKKVTRS